MKTTNWKKEFDKYFIGDPGVLTETSFPNGQGIKDFISHQIIEKIIEDIPDDRIYKTPDEFFGRTATIKQQLRDKWLNQPK